MTRNAVLIGERINQDQLHALMPPDPMGPRHRPTPFADIDDIVLTQLQAAFPEVDIDTQYVIGQKGLHAFATYELLNNDNFNTVIGWRSAYDQAMSTKIVFGKSVFFCSNMQFSADGVLAFHKNTESAWGGLWRRFAQGLATVLPVQEREMTDFRDRLIEAPCSTDEGYELLGLALGRGVLTPQQVTPALRQWQDPPENPEFQERTQWALYNACTEGLKKGRISTVTERYSGITELFQQVAA